MKKRFKCPHCSCIMTVSDEHRGLNVKCPVCGQILRTPPSTPPREEDMDPDPFFWDAEWDGEVTGEESGPLGEEYSPFRRETYGSDSSVDFRAAYDRRPMLNALVGLMWVFVFVFAIWGALSLVSGHLSRGLGLLVLAVVDYLFWTILNQWALTHPKY